MTIIWFIQFLIPIILAVNSLNIIQAAVIPVIHIHPVNHGGQTTPTPSTQYSDKKIPAPTSIFSSDTINSIPASLTNAISNVISKNNDDINDDDLSKLDLSKMNLTQLLLENQQRLDELEKERDSLIWNSVDNDGNVDENKNPSINDNTNNGLVAKARAELLDIKIHQLYDIKDIAKDVLALFYRVTHSVSHSEGIQETISEIKKESSEIIDEFQHTVAKAKAEYFDLTNSERKHLADAAAAAAASTAIEIEDNSSGQDESSFPSGAAAVTSPPPQSQAPSVFGTVAEHAEKLETSMKSQDSTNVFAESQDKRGASIETVVKLVEDDVSEEEEEEENNDSSPTSPPSAQHSDDNNVINGTIIASADGYKSFNGTDDEGSEGGDGDDEEEEESTPVSHQHKKQPNLDKMPVLIDSENNQYVMSKSNDITLIYEDSRLMNDLVVMLFISALLSYLMTLLRLPLFFGYILAGIFLGQGDYLKSTIQVETISHNMGIIFIMFVLGLEFNYSKISKVWRISLLGSLALLAVTVLIIFLLGQYFFDADSVKESLIIGFTVFLSSTAVVLKCLEPDEMDTLYGRSIIGILVAQDLLLGLLLAILPSFGKASFLHMAQSLASIMGVMIIFLLIVGSLYPFIQYIIKLILHSKRNRELLVMSSIGLCVFLTKIAANFNLPVELACFVAGVVISPPEKHQDTLIHTIEPIRDMFSALFFACIGLHIYPTFLIDEAALLFGLTVATTLFKFVVGVLVLFLLFRYDLRTASFIAIALSQMSEFAFLFASRAKSMGLISREVYYLLLATTALSLIVSPLIWRVCGPSHHQKSCYKRLEVFEEDDQHYNEIIF